MGNDIVKSGEFESINLKEALEERYLAYALSTITQRALPDVRDGMKPVHRRILYAMRLLKMDPSGGFKKSARVVGDVIGKYHPHGDTAVYDAMVRLAQDFASRYPLVDGQGNFGNIDGDSAAAMRYTEARMTEVARLMMEGIDEDAVDFRETYDGEDKEPVVLPANFPNLLANGSSGIAVGMATSIPPHNVAELCEASLHLIKSPNCTDEKLFDLLPGPDFPTGGILVESKEQIHEAYRTGRGGFRVRAKWVQEPLARGAYQIVVTEIPYQVQKSRLIERIADLVQNRRLPLLIDVRDESAEDIRLVLEPKNRSVDPDLLMEALFKLTDLESRFSLNMNVLDHIGVPRVLSIRQVLQQWLNHRRDVLQRRSRFRLSKIEHRLEVLEGYLIAYLNLDEVIRIIRYEDEPKGELIKTFKLTDVQAEAILNMRLRSLRKLEEFEIQSEHDALSKEREGLLELLGSDELQWKSVSKQLREIYKIFGPDTDLGRRRTDFGVATERDIDDINMAMVEREPVTLVLSEKGWIRAMRGHITDYSTLNFKDGDKLKFAVHAETTDKLLIMATCGRFYTLQADKLPGGRGHGEPIRVMVDMEPGIDVVDLFVHKSGRKLLLASTDGRGFVTSEDGLIANTRKGKQVLNVSAPNEARLCVEAVGDHIAVIGENRKMIVFPLEQLPEMTRGRGVMLQRYKDGGISDVKVFTGAEGLSWNDSSGRNYTRSLEELGEWLGERAQAGRMPPNGFPRSNKFSN
ncbi:DNA topoisomerase IV subunit A [Cohaesibacter celericrescens]|uniref:DNA topoisomerase 4 subunit A n=1 Tax=Cohaesibacter celericrescens TaxID=2067669 RepID=A0A2N5XQD4_9HYPH|nr:DNA topoisomerase IV subunit A [Cohaesibacter celericrescens]PLW76731.1 DNA topoisomerase IV subunit A [Cohaesibacter celericrescens]